MQIELNQKYLAPYDNLEDKSLEDIENLLSEEILSQSPEEHVKYIITVPQLAISKQIIDESDIDDYNDLAERLSDLKGQIMDDKISEIDVYSEDYPNSAKCKELRLDLTKMTNKILFNFFTRAKLGVKEYYDKYEESKSENT